jgi:Holliday junction resolvase RusA-like endonuclease
MTFDLPLPPGVNNLFASILIKGKQRRIITRDYKAWREQAAKVLDCYSADPLPKPYGAHIRVNVNHRSDIDGRIKAVLDALVTANVIVGDQWLNTLRVDRDPTVRECTVEVWSMAE